MNTTSHCGRIVRCTSTHIQWTAIGIVVFGIVYLVFDSILLVTMAPGTFLIFSHIQYTLCPFHSQLFSSKRIINVCPNTIWQTWNSYQFYFSQRRDVQFGWRKSWGEMRMWWHMFSWFRCLEETTIRMWCHIFMIPIFGRDKNKNVSHQESHSHIPRLSGNLILFLPQGNLRFLAQSLQKENVSFNKFSK